MQRKFFLILVAFLVTLPSTCKSKNATLRHEIFMMQSNVTRWAPGDHANRPAVETPYENLYLAGEWVNTNAPVFLMEAAAFTGRQAANAIADRADGRDFCVRRGGDFHATESFCVLQAYMLS